MVDWAPIQTSRPITMPLELTGWLSDRCAGINPVLEGKQGGPGRDPCAFPNDDAFPAAVESCVWIDAHMGCERDRAMHEGVGRDARPGSDNDLSVRFRKESGFFGHETSRVELERFKCSQSRVDLALPFFGPGTHVGRRIEVEPGHERHALLLLDLQLLLPFHAEARSTAPYWRKNFRSNVSEADWPMLGREQKGVFRTRTDGSGPQETIAEMFEPFFWNVAFEDELRVNAAGSIWRRASTELHFVPMPQVSD